jgi:hypothetical protein
MLFFFSSTRIAYHTRCRGRRQIFMFAARGERCARIFRARSSAF